MVGISGNIEVIRALVAQGKFDSLEGRLNGRQLAEAARALYCGLKILLSTGYAAERGVGGG